MNRLLVWLAETVPVESTRAVLCEGSRQVTREATVQRVHDVDEAVSISPSGGAEAIVLVNPKPAEVEKADAMVDGAGLPRWAVVVLGGPKGGDLTREEWNARNVARALRAALQEHAARKECLRVRGDLKTLGHRFAHDLRAQLGGILTTAELLHEVLVGAGGSPTQVEPIFQSAEGTVKLLERISFVTRASATPRKPESVNMGIAFWSAHQRLEAQLMRQGATLVQPPSWPDVVGVTDWLEVVWWNLLANALQHAGAKPTIRVGWEESPDEHKFWTRDDGKGVAPDKRSLLFHPLHRLHEPNAPNGFGLAIVQRLVELQGGRCSYEPLAEGGSGFDFTIPKEKARSEGEVQINP